jgi:predicted amidohydrolase YtcJ
MAATLTIDATAYINGRIYTVNESQPWAEAFIASSQGTFELVGSRAEILTVAERDHLPVYDLKNVFVMPGIHDAHVHLLYAGYALLNDVDVGLDATNENIASKLKHGCCACAYTQVYQDWIIANGFNIDNFDRSTLDKDFPDTPVVMRGGAGHNMYVNTEALRRAGIDPEHEMDTQASRFVRRKDGSLTGELSETAMDKIAMAIPYPKPSHVKRCLKHAISVAHQQGVTSMQEAASNTAMLEALGDLDREGALKIDIAAHIVHSPQYIGWEPRESLHKLLDNAGEYRTKHIDTRFLKIILDGVPLAPLYTQAELNADGRVNRSKLTVPDLGPIIETFDNKGVTCKIHCTGEGSTRFTLDAIEATRKKNPAGPRHEIAHCSGVHAGKPHSTFSDRQVY